MGGVEGEVGFLQIRETDVRLDPRNHDLRKRQMLNNCAIQAPPPFLTIIVHYAFFHLTIHFEDFYFWGGRKWRKGQRGRRRERERES